MDSNLREKIKAAARVSAAQFRDEFGPGALLSGSDWDSEAHAIDSANQGWPGEDESWELYRTTMREHLALLNRDWSLEQIKVSSDSPPKEHLTHAGWYQCTDGTWAYISERARFSSKPLDHYNRPTTREEDDADFEAGGRALRGA